MDRAVHPVLVARDKEGASTPANATSDGLISQDAQDDPVDGRIVVVRTGRKTRPRSKIAWLVGVLAMTEAILEAGDAALQARGWASIWWLVGSLMVFTFAMRVEAFKRPG